MKSRNRFILFTVMLLLGVPAISGQVKKPAQQEIRALQQTAQQLEALGSLEKAGELYGQVALAMAPNRDINSYSSAKYCFERIKALDPWEALILELQKSFRSLRFEVDLAEIAYLRGNKETAFRQWRQVIESNPVDDQAYVLVGSALLTYHLFDEAQWSYERGRKAFKDPSKFFFELVQVYQAQGAFAKMTEEYLAFLRKNPAQLGYVQTQLLAAGSEPEAVQQIAEGIERSAKSPDTLRITGYRLLGALYTQDRQYAKALRCYEVLEANAREKNPAEQGQYYYRFANVAMNDGALPEARAALQAMSSRLDEKNAYRVHAAFALAQLLEKEGLFDQAAAAYESFIRSYPEWPEMPALYLRLGRLYFDHFFNLEAADNAYRRMLSRPQLPVALRLMGYQQRAVCAIARGDLKAAKELLERLKRETPPAFEQHRQADLMLARINLYEGRPTQAFHMLAKLISSPSARKVAKADTVQNDALELYLLLRENQRDSLGLSLLGRGLWLQQQRKAQESLDTLGRVLLVTKNSALREQAQLEQIGLLRKMRRPAEALAVCAAMNGDSTTLSPDLALKTTADIYAEMADSQKALKLYETFLEKYPESIYIELVRSRIRALQLRAL